MNALEIVERKILDPVELLRMRAIWAFQKHSVSVAVFAASELSNEVIDRINAMADTADRLIVLCTQASALKSLASLHHLAAVCLMEASSIDASVAELRPDVVACAAGFVEPEIPESTVLIRMA